MNGAIDQLKTVTATALTLSPFWLESLKGVSEMAALLMPIFGLGWLIIQIFDHFRGK